MYLVSLRSDSSSIAGDRIASREAEKPVRRRRYLGALAALGLATAAVVAFPSDALAAGEKDKDALKLHDQAMDEDYLAVEFGKAEKKLKDALKKCGADGCTPNVLAKLHIAMGTVHGANNKLDLAKEEFIAALKLDSSVTLNESLTTPELAKAFKEAVKAAGVTVKPAGDKPTGDKPTGDKPTGDKPTKPKPVTDGDEPPKKSAGDLSHTPPAEQLVNTPVPIYIEIPEDVGAAKVSLRYKPFGGTKWKTIPMEPVGDGFGAEIPCEDVTTTGDIKYFIIAKDDAGDPAGTAGSMKEPFKVPIKNEIDGDAPSLPGKKPPEECAAKEDCPPGLPGCPGKAPVSSRIDGKPWGSSCETTQECKEGLVCLNGACEEGGAAGGQTVEPTTKKKRNIIGLSGQLDLLVINGGAEVCSGKDASYVCFYSGSDRQFYGFPETKEGTNGIQGGFGLAGGRVLLSYERLLVENMGFTAGIRIGYGFGGSPTPANAPYAINHPKYDKDEFGGQKSPHAEANSFLGLHVEARASYYFGGSALEMKKVRPYVFLGGGVSQVNASVPVTVCDQTYDEGSNKGKQVSAADNQGKCDRAEIRKLDAYQITGLNFIGFGGGATFGITPNFGVMGELKLMMMLPTFGFVVAPTIGPVVAF